MGAPTEPDGDLFDDAEETKPPVILAAFPGACTGCAWEFDEGDPIRSDGHGGWEHDEC